MNHKKILSLFVAVGLLSCASMVGMKREHGDREPNEQKKPRYTVELNIRDAAGVGDLERIQQLVNSGASVDEPGMNGWRPLHRAVRSRHLGVVQYLVEKGALVDAQDSFGWTPLIFAVCNGHFEIAKYLVEQGAKIDVKDYCNWTLLHHAAASSGESRFELVKYLIEEKKVLVDIKNNLGDTPLHMAAQKGHLDVVKYLIEKGVQVDIKNNQGKTPLHCAAENNHPEVLKYLIEKGTQVDMQDNDGFTSLCYAAYIGHLEAVKCLVENGAQIDAQDRDCGCTPLHYAVIGVKPEVIKYLTKKGAQVIIQNKEGNTPLHIATYYGFLELVKAICEPLLGLNGLLPKNLLELLKIKDKRGKAAVALAQEKNKQEKNKQEKNGLEKAFPEKDRQGIVDYLTDITKEAKTFKTPLLKTLENGEKTDVLFGYKADQLW